jgi:hypothetical protein
MKRHLLGFSSIVGLAVLAGCMSESEDPASEDAAITANKLDDTFATTVLKGGCEIDGIGKTTGSGGKCPTKLSAILDALPQDKVNVFVVSEKADMPKDDDTTYRFVVSAGTEEAPLFIATVGGKQLGEGSTEAIGFSKSLQAYAYYKVEGTRWVRKGDGTQVKANNNKGTDAPFECIRCHSSGAPLMKEIHDSWGNWESTWFRMDAPPGANALFKRLFDQRKRADILERKIIPAIKLHSKGRVDRAKKEGALKGVLTQLMCEVGEPSLIGAHNASEDRTGTVKSSSTMLPTAILVNQLLVPPATGGTGVELGLEDALKLKVPSLDALGEGIDADAYSKQVKANGQKIGGRTSGDTIFPMSSPEKSYADLDAIQELLRQKLIDKDIVADILMTDFTVSSFSKVRCDLADTLPETWKTPAELKSAWAKNLEGSRLRGAKGLRARLEKASDLKNHEKTLETFAKACSERKPAELTKDVLAIMSQRRVEFADRYSNVIESPWLVPTDTLRSKANGVRLSGKTCEIEETKSKFIDEE